MITSIYRYSHLVLAAISSLFLVVAAITGLVLSTEPIFYDLKQPDKIDLSEISLGQTIHKLQQEYDELITLSTTSQGLVLADVVTKEGTSVTGYINPKTGMFLGDEITRPSIYNWFTNLHRSLFLKSIGRGFIGVSTFLLVLIIVSGIFLLAQRQGGFSKWFSSIKDKEFHKKYHVILSRWLLIPILIIAITGVYLSLEQFDLIPVENQSLDWSLSPDEELLQQTIENQAFFKTTTLDQVKEVNFPFSSDPIDYYEIYLKEKSVLVAQHTGEVIDQVENPFTALVSYYSTLFHTGSASPLWSVILGISCIGILYFIISGCVIYWKRRPKKNYKLELSSAQDSEYIVLVGSESGSTYAFAKAFTQQLLSTGKKVFLSDLNHYQQYERALHLIIFTATYGDGDAPTNARKFFDKLEKIDQPRSLFVSVVGFGSSIYPKYNEFGKQVYNRLVKDENMKPYLPFTEVDEEHQPEETCKQWLQLWQQKSGFPMELKVDQFPKSNIEKQKFKVTHRSPLNKDETFIISLQPTSYNDYQSGDLLEVYASETAKARQYSIARIQNKIVLSVRKHDHGLCSTYLANCHKNDDIMATIKTNTSFHFPKDAPKIIMVANGTGIAPFLGMLDENKTNIPVDLYWGGKNIESLSIYGEYLEDVHKKQQVSNYHISYSRENEVVEYVQHKVAEHKEQITTDLLQGAVIMICGSLSMQNEVLDLLELWNKEKPEIQLEQLYKNQKILTDCY
ncbi:MAG: PepSY domain-containing protein [Bacteroidota bacterium]|nr:PepSY domain-containing protein [Bacteroidota bacterium]